MNVKYKIIPFKKKLKIQLAETFEQKEPMPIKFSAFHEFIKDETRRDNLARYGDYVKQAVLNAAEDGICLDIKDELE